MQLPPLQGPHQAHRIHGRHQTSLPPSEIPRMKAAATSNQEKQCFRCGPNNHHPSEHPLSGTFCHSFLSQDRPTLPLHLPPIRSPNYSPLSQPGRPRTGLAAPETEGESRSHEGRVALSPAAQTPINCKCFGAQNPNNPQCFWENEPVALRGGSAPLPDEAHTKGPQPSLSTQSVNPAKVVSCARTWGRVQHYGPQWAPWAVSGPGVT